VRRGDDAARIQLTGLTGTAVAALAGGRPGDGLLRLADGAAGNSWTVTRSSAASRRRRKVALDGAASAPQDARAGRSRVSRPQYEENF
jgi:hypothetical protein